MRIRLQFLKCCLSSIDKIIEVWVNFEAQVSLPFKNSTVGAVSFGGIKGISKLEIDMRCESQYSIVVKVLNVEERGGGAAFGH